MKTAEELGLNSDEYEALKQVRCLLDTGTIPEENFKMNHWFYTEYSCGTVACIGGWMQVLLGTQNPSELLANHPFTDQVAYHEAALCSVRSGTFYEGKPNRLHELFFPLIPRHKWRYITPQQAVKAIDNVLETGRPNWEEVVQET